MSGNYKLIVRLEQVEEKDLPQLIAALQLAGRRLHADAMLIAGGEPPEIVLYGEDLVHGMPNTTVHHGHGVMGSKE